MLASCPYAGFLEGERKTYKCLSSEVVTKSSFFLFAARWSAARRLAFFFPTSARSILIALY